MRWSLQLSSRGGAATAASPNLARSQPEQKKIDQHKHISKKLISDIASKVEPYSYAVLQIVSQTSQR
jgi:hypothetical protein